MANRKSGEDSLREKAENLLKSGKAGLVLPDGIDMEILLHELGVHQIVFEGRTRT